jgi:RNA polymerase sigma factor (sigma-70 family)
MSQSPSSTALERAHLDDSTEALEALPADQRQSIHLVHYAGFTTTQVAELLGVPVDVINSRLADGMLRLRRAA